MMNAESNRSGRFVLWIATVVAVSLAGAAMATQDVRVTAVQGDTSVKDTALTGRGQLGEGQELKTGADGGCSVLIDRNAVVELCGHSHVTFRRDDKDGNRIVNIDSGTVKLVIEPREPGERIEIHTPAAVATILGTIVYVSVDPVTGATTISSSQSQVNIKAKGDPAADPGTTIGAFEQLTIVPGEKKQAKKKITKRQLDELSSCLGDFHDIAVNIDRSPREKKMLERIGDPADTPPVGAGPIDLFIPSTDPDPPEPELTPVDTVPELGTPEPPPREVAEQMPEPPPPGFPTPGGDNSE